MRAANFQIMCPYIRHGQGSQLVGLHFGSGGGILCIVHGERFAFQVAGVAAFVNHALQLSCFFLSLSSLNLSAA